MTDWQIGAAGWLLWFVTGGLLGTILLTYWGVRSAHPGRQIAVLGGQVLVTVCLWLLIIDPRTERVGTERRTVSTHGATGPAAFALDRGGAGQAVADLAALRRQVPGLAELRVLGRGLPAAAWREHPDIRIVPEGGDRPSGLVDLRWPESVQLGRSVVLSGRVQVETPEGWRLALRGAADLVVAEATAGADGRFKLAVAPKVAGQRLYRLEARPPSDRSGSRASHAGPVPLWVDEAPRLRAGIRLGRPSFEAAAVVRWLKSIGWEVTSRTELAPEVVRTEAIGEGLPDLSRLSPSDLDGLDLLLLDPPTLASLQAVERRALAVALDGGLGLLVFADEELQRMPQSILKDILAGVLIADRGDPAVVDLAGTDLSVTRAGISISGSAAETRLRTASGEALVVVKTVGLGRVGLTVMRDSYAWASGGNGERHAALWSQVLDALVRPTRESAWVETATTIPSPGERVRSCRWIDGGVECQDQFPARAGWFQPVWGAPVYVYERSDWPAWRADVYRADTDWAARRHGVGVGAAVRLQSVFSEDLLFMLLLMGWGGVFLERKFRPGRR